MRIYDGSIAHLRQAMQRFVTGVDGMAHVRAFYPLVRIHTDTVSRSITPESARLSYGFVAGPGRFETTLTRPDLYHDYYLDQFNLLLQTTKSNWKSAPVHNPYRCTSLLRRATMWKAI